MDDWNLDEESLIKWQQLQCCEFKMSNCFVHGMPNNGRFTFSGGDTS